MKIRHALIIALVLTIAIANVFFLSSFQSSKNLKQTVLVTRVIDGDTLVIDAGVHVRLLNINAPEKDVATSSYAAEYLRNFQNKTILLESTGEDKYQRTLARIYTQDGRYLNLELVENGFSSKFLVQESELSLFSKGESRAIEESKGMWSHSIYYSCLTSEIDKYKEIVIIINKCPSINFSKFTLKDESRKTFTFPSIAFDKLLIHSGKGASNSTDIFWSQSTDVWNNDRDTLYIFDNDGKIIHYNSYGY